MQKRIYIAALLLLFSFAVVAQEVPSQVRPTMTRTALSKMDVLSRAVLFEQAIASAALRERVDPKILWAIAYNETRFRPWLTSPKNARGLMQFLPATAARFGLGDPYESTAAISAAAKYVKYLGQQFDWRLDSVLAAYNSGEGTVSAYLQGRPIRSKGRLINASGARTVGGVPPYKETINYVSQGVRIFRWLEKQGKFLDRSKESEVDATNQAGPQEQATSENRSKAENAGATMMFYDPRTGRRIRLTTSGRDPADSASQDGPVIISPDLRGFPAWAARSTFAGVGRP